MAHELTRDYDRIRPVLERIYTYGYYSREDFEHQNIMKKSGYDKELQRLQSILPSDRFCQEMMGSASCFILDATIFPIVLPGS